MDLFWQHGGISFKLLQVLHVKKTLEDFLNESDHSILVMIQSIDTISFKTKVHIQGIAHKKMLHFSHYFKTLSGEWLCTLILLRVHQQRKIVPKDAFMSLCFST
jgi:hypothetical protein